MNDQDKLELVQQTYSNFKNGDIESLLAMMSDDIEWEIPQTENMPFTGKRHGKEMVREFFNTMGMAQESLEFNPMEFITQGDKVVALGHYEWKTRESGQPYGGDWAHVFTISNGKITGFHEYMDTAAVANAYKKQVVQNPVA